MAEPPQPPEPPPSRREPLLARVIGAGARSGARVAEAAGIDQAVEDLAADAVVRALESPAAERAIAQALESAAVERSINRAIDSEMIDRVWERLLASDEVQKLVERIAEAPESRQAIAAQGFGLIDDIGAQIARIARHVDDVLERIVRRILRRPKRQERAEQAGLFTRGLAFLIDGAIVNGIFFLTATLLALAIDAVFDVNNASDSATLVVGSLTWILATSTYLVGFWGLSGETPGMRFLDLRLYGPDGPRLGFRRSVRRLVGVVLGAIPLGLGFWIALFGEKRRTFADRLAETEMRYLPPRREAPWAASGEDARDVSAAPV
jgi:uncharacterized RDD family membrane protein YckC